jgi:hypothetical protein
MNMRGRVAHIEAADSGWRGLYRTGGAAAVIAVVLFRRNLGAEFSLLRITGIISFGPATTPRTAVEWFSLLQGNALLGLVLLEIFDLVNYALVGLIFLALYGALRRDNKSAMVIATVLGLVGIAVSFATNHAFALLSLSDRYAAAATDAQRSMFLAAGEALLATSNPGAIYQGTGIYASLLLVTLAGIIISVVMLRSSVFGTATACAGILAGVFGLGYFGALALAPAVRAAPPSISAVFLLVWYLRIGRRLFRLGAGAPGEEARE